MNDVQLIAMAEGEQDRLLYECGSLAQAYGFAQGYYNTDYIFMRMPKGRLEFGRIDNGEFIKLGEIVGAAY